MLLDSCRSSPLAMTAQGLFLEEGRGAPMILAIVRRALPVCSNMDCHGERRRTISYSVEALFGLRL